MAQFQLLIVGHQCVLWCFIASLGVYGILNSPLTTVVIYLFANLQVIYFLFCLNFIYCKLASGYIWLNTIDYHTPGTSAGKRSEVKRRASIKIYIHAMWYLSSRQLYVYIYIYLYIQCVNVA